MTPCSRSRPGAALLLLVLVVGIAALVVSLGVAFRAIQETAIGFAAVRSQQAMAIADGCMEDSIFRLKQDASYAGSALVLGGGSCTVSVSGSSTSKTVTVTAFVGTVTKKEVATVTITSPTPPATVATVTLVNWRQSTL